MHGNAKSEMKLNELDYHKHVQHVHNKKKKMLPICIKRGIIGHKPN